MQFRWNEWNENDVSEHGVEPEEAEEVVRGARPPYPLTSADEKFLVWVRPPKGNSCRSSS